MKTSYKKYTIGKILFLSLIITSLTSCSAIYGIKKIKPVNEKTILHYSSKYKIPSINSYQLNNSYISLLTSLDSNRYNEQRKNHFQPLQALYYNKSGQLASFHINCYTGGFPNLKWNRNGRMDVFPPKEQAPLDSIISLSAQLNHINPVAKATKQEFIDLNKDYVVVVYWSKFMGRQSKKFIKQIQRNVKLAENNQAIVIYVNTDNVFAEATNKK